MKVDIKILKLEWLDKPDDTGIHMLENPGLQ